MNDHTTTDELRPEKMQTWPTAGVIGTAIFGLAITVTGLALIARARAAGAL